MTLEEAMEVRVTADRVEAIMAVAALQEEVLRLRAKAEAATALLDKVAAAFAYRAPETFNGSQFRALKELGDYLVAKREAGKP